MFGHFLGGEVGLGDTVNFRHLYGIAALNDPNENSDDGQYQENVDESAKRVRSDHSE
jgi:hypothetical protein